MRIRYIDYDDINGIIIHPAVINYRQCCSGGVFFSELISNYNITIADECLVGDEKDIFQFLMEWS